MSMLNRRREDRSGRARVFRGTSPCRHPTSCKRSDSPRRTHLAIHDAYVASNSRLWSQIEPICAQVAGSDAVAKKIGMNTCIHLVLNTARAADGQATDDAMREVGEIRAGLSQPPKPGDSVSPVLPMFLALTGESEKFQNDLARTFGPDEAHRLAFANGMCAVQAEFGGSSPK